MSSPESFTGIIHRYLQGLALATSASAKLQALDAVELHMTEAQFDIATSQLRMTADNIAIARLFFVDGLSAQQLKSSHDVNPSRLSKVVKRVGENYQKQLERLNLVAVEYTLDAETAALVRELELSRIRDAKQRLAQTTKGKTKNKS